MLRAEVTSKEHKRYNSTVGCVLIYRQIDPDGLLPTAEEKWRVSRVKTVLQDRRDRRSARICSRAAKWGSSYWISR